MKIKSTLIAVVLGLSSIASANAASPDWDLVEVGYAQSDIDGLGSFDPAGLTLLGSKLITDDVFVFASYSSLSDDFADIDLDLDQASAGLGYRFGINQTTDLYGAVSYEYIDISGAGQSIDDNGYGLTLGVRTRLTEAFELDASLGYLDIGDDSDTTYSVGANYYFTENFAAGLKYSGAEDVNTFAATLRYAF